MCREKAGYGLKQCSAALEVKKAKVPILFIHGDADTFVPCSMCFEIYENCASKKNMLIVHGAGHVEAFYKEQALYEQKLTEFLETAGEAGRCGKEHLCIRCNRRGKQRGIRSRLKMRGV